MTNTLSIKKPQTVKEWMETSSFKEQVAKALPKHLTADRFIRVALTTLLMIPRLAECYPPTVLACLLKCSSLGIEPDGRRAHLIPFHNSKEKRTDCQLIIDYKGYVELVRRSGEVSYIHADVVRRNDKFEISYGSCGCLKHVPCLDSDPGEIVCAYSYVKLKDGSEDYRVMRLSEIERVRDNSQNYKTAKSKGYGSVWDEHFAEMAKKTIFRNHIKWLTLSPEVHENLSKDEDVIDVPSNIDFTPRMKAAGLVENQPSLDDGKTSVVAEVMPETPSDDVTSETEVSTTLTPEQEYDALQAKHGFADEEVVDWCVKKGIIRAGLKDPRKFPGATLVRVIEALPELLKGGN